LYGTDSVKDQEKEVFDRYIE